MRHVAGDFIGIFDACPDGRASEIITGEKDAGRASGQNSDGGYYALMADVVLRQGTAPARDVLAGRFAGYAQNRSKLRIGDGGDLVGRFRKDVGIGHSTQKACESSHSGGGAFRE